MSGKPSAVKFRVKVRRGNSWEYISTVGDEYALFILLFTLLAAGEEKAILVEKS